MKEVLLCNRGGPGEEVMIHWVLMHQKQSQETPEKCER